MQLAACTSARKTAISPAPAVPANEPTISFIDDISTAPVQISTRHRSRKYVSPENNRPIVKSSRLLENKYAQILGVSPAAITNTTLYDFIDDWWGTPYKYGGNSRDGIDCSAFVQQLYNDVYNINLARTSLELYHKVVVITKKHLQEGDLIFFRTTRRKRVTHVGVYLQNNKFVQASASSGVTISDLSDTYWQAHYAGAGRVKNGS
jgi:lipoprotein Spr